MALSKPANRQTKSSQIESSLFIAIIAIAMIAIADIIHRNKTNGEQEFEPLTRLTITSSAGNCLEKLYQ